MHGHQMDRYARACPTCGAARDPLWLPRALRAEEDHEARRTAHFALIALLIIGLLAVYLAFRPTNHPTAESDVCHTADAVFLTEMAPTGAYDAYSEKFAGERQALERISQFVPAIQDETIRGEAEALQAGFSLPQLTSLIKTCRAKGYLK
jgi:hypothetical protein